jgi:hypothetical protein
LQVEETIRITPAWFRHLMSFEQHELLALVNSNDFTWDRECLSVLREKYPQMEAVGGVDAPIRLFQFVSALQVCIERGLLKVGTLVPQLQHDAPMVQVIEQAQVKRAAFESDPSYRIFGNVDWVEAKRRAQPMERRLVKQEPGVGGDAQAGPELVIDEPDDDFAAQQARPPRQWEERFGPDGRAYWAPLPRQDAPTPKDVCKFKKELSHAILHARRDGFRVSDHRGDLEITKEQAGLLEPSSFDLRAGALLREAAEQTVTRALPLRRMSLIGEVPGMSFIANTPKRMKRMWSWLRMAESFRQENVGKGKKQTASQKRAAKRLARELEEEGATELLVADHKLWPGERFTVNMLKSYLQRHKIELPRVAKAGQRDNLLKFFNQLFKHGQDANGQTAARLAVEKELGLQLTKKRKKKRKGGAVVPMISSDDDDSEPEESDSSSSADESSSSESPSSNSSDSEVELRQHRQQEHEGYFLAQLLQLLTRY